MPNPKEGESRKDFVSRCVPIVLEDGTCAWLLVVYVVVF